MPAHHFQWRTFWGLMCGFIIVVPAGTLLHESAHYLAGKLTGYEGYISYHSTIYTFIPDEGNAQLNKRLLVTLAGPLQTMLTGLLGLFLLWYHRRSFHKSRQLNLRHWIMVFLSLFWLRQLFNLLIWLLSGLIHGSFAKSTDEIRIARYLHWPDWLILGFSGIVGLLITGTVFVKYIPAEQKKTFLIAGICGCATGYLLWFGWLGKVLLPV